MSATLQQRDLAGRVRDATGAPVGGALVAALSLEAGADDRPPVLAESLADGSFTLPDLRSGRYALSATFPGKTGALIDDVTPGGRTVELRVGGPGVVFFGDVRDLQGGSVPAALVELRSGGRAWYARTDRQGHYRVSVPPGDYTLRGISRGYVAVSHPNYSAEPARRVDLELEPEDASRFVTREVLEQIRGRAIVSTSDPASDLQDLDSLQELIGSQTRVVGLGESTHGGHEILQLKARLFRFLVERRGFTVLAIEASWPDSIALNRYVLTGEGDPALLVPRMRFWVWDTEEVVDLVRWMRRYNADPAHMRKLKFVGIDMQYSSTSARALWAYLRGAGVPTSFGSALAVLADEFQTSWQNVRGWSGAQKTAVSRGLSALVRHLEDHRALLVTRTGEDAWASARHHAEILQQFLHLNVEPTGPRSEVRDALLAKNVLQILRDDPNARVAIWAHNAHLSKSDPLDSRTAMGILLRQALGSAYVVLATTFWDGEIRAMGVEPARGLRTFKMPGPPPAGSLEGTLGGIAGEVVGIDFHRLSPSGAAGRWSRHYLRTRSGSAAYSESYGQELEALHPASCYDAVFMVRKLTPSRYLGPPLQPTIQQLAAPSNSDFEAPPASPPTGWLSAGGGANTGYVATADAKEPFQGRQSARISLPRPPRMLGWGGLEQRVDAKSWRGSRVCLRAAVRVEGDDAMGGARLYVRAVDGDDGIRVSTSTSLLRHAPWQVHELFINVPLGASTLRYGLAVSGEVTAWLDDVTVGRWPALSCVGRPASPSDASRALRNGGEGGSP